MSVVTKQGDCGLSSLVYNGGMISKSHIIFDTFGDIDELNTSIAKTVHIMYERRENNKHLEPIITILTKLNDDLYVIMGYMTKLNSYIINKTHSDNADVFNDQMRSHIDDLDTIIKNMEPFLDHTIHLQKNNKRNIISCEIDVSRSIARRAERTVWKLHEEIYGQVSLIALVGKYMNRLSDLLYVLAMNKIVLHEK